MKVLLASPRGFCAGVNMAIESLDLALASLAPPIYVYHEIVHNKYVVEHFRGRGVTFVDDLADVPVGATLLFSAHGVSPEIRRVARERNLRAIDATCPLVTKVHLEAIKYAQAGYTILLIGHEGHDEVIGTMGEAPEAIVLVETPEDVATLQVADESKVAYLTQTTLSVDDANRIISPAARSGFPTSPRRPRTTSATPRRTARRPSRCWPTRPTWPSCWAARTARTASDWPSWPASAASPAYLVDGPADLDPAWFDGAETVLVTAGASAPEQVVDECLDWLRERFGATVEPRSIREESVSFPLPRELRSLATNALEQFQRSVRSPLAASAKPQTSSITSATTPAAPFRCGVCGVGTRRRPVATASRT